MAIGLPPKAGSTPIKQSTDSMTMFELRELVFNSTYAEEIKAGNEPGMAEDAACTVLDIYTTRRGLNRALAMASSDAGNFAH